MPPSLEDGASSLDNTTDSNSSLSSPIKPRDRSSSEPYYGTLKGEAVFGSPISPAPILVLIYGSVPFLNVNICSLSGGILAYIGTAYILSSFTPVVVGRNAEESWLSCICVIPTTGGAHLSTCLTRCFLTSLSLSWRLIYSYVALGPLSSSSWSDSRM